MVRAAEGHTDGKKQNTKIKNKAARSATVKKHEHKKKKKKKKKNCPLGCTAPR
jgi:hypothetical protein